MMRAYPRGRGATLWWRSYSEFGYGLSPRTRGNQMDDPFAAVPLGPIPADAGQPKTGKDQPK